MVGRFPLLVFSKALTTTLKGKLWVYCTSDQLDNDTLTAVVVVAAARYEVMVGGRQRHEGESVNQSDASNGSW